jgi:hypothetical protein
MDEDRGDEADGPGGSTTIWPASDGPSNPAGGAPPPQRTRRFIEAAAWVVGIVAVLFFAGVFGVLGGSQALTARGWGQLTGAIVGSVIVGLVARWLVVRIRRRGRVRSPWILVVAVLVLLLNPGRQPAIGAPADAGLPIDTYMRIGSPYALATPSADETAPLTAALTAASAGAFEIKRVTQDGQVVGLFVVADMGADASPDYRRGLEQGWTDDGGDEAHDVPIAGLTAVLGTRPAGAGVLWVEPPYVLTVYAADSDTAQSIAGSIIAAYH